MSKHYTESLPEFLSLKVASASEDARVVGVYFYGPDAESCTSLDGGYWILDRGPDAAKGRRFYTVIGTDEPESDCLQEVEQYLAQSMLLDCVDVDGMFYSWRVHQAIHALAWVRTQTDYWDKCPSFPPPVRGFHDLDANEFGEVEWMELIECAFGCECPSYDSDEWSEEQFNPFGPGAKMGTDEIVEAQFALASARFWSAIRAASRGGAM